MTAHWSIPSVILEIVVKNIPGANAASGIAGESAMIPGQRPSPEATMPVFVNRKTAHGSEDIFLDGLRLESQAQAVMDWALAAKRHLDSIIVVPLKIRVQRFKKRFHRDVGP